MSNNQGEPYLLNESTQRQIDPLYKRLVETRSSTISSVPKKSTGLLCFSWGPNLSYSKKLVERILNDGFIQN